MSISELFESVLGLELLNTSTTLCELLLSCKERVASGANISSDLFLCGSGHECVAACASYFTFLVLRMDSLFHAFHLFHISVSMLPHAACIIYHSPRIEIKGFFTIPAELNFTAGIHLSTRPSPGAAGFSRKTRAAPV